MLRSLATTNYGSQAQTLIINGLTLNRAHNNLQWPGLCECSGQQLKCQLDNIIWSSITALSGYIAAITLLMMRLLLR